MRPSRIEPASSRVNWPPTSTHSGPFLLTGDSSPVIAAKRNVMPDSRKAEGGSQAGIA
jgi:hypothetical protein